MLNSVYAQLISLTLLFFLFGALSSLSKNRKKLIFLIGFSVMPPAAAIIAFHGTGAPWRRWLIVVMVTIYTARLAYILLVWFKNTGAAKLEIRSLAARLTLPTILTATCCWIYCAPFFWAADRKGNMDVWDALAIGLYCIGTVIHFGADWQKRKFRQDPGNKGKLLSSGLWGMSRHPNYFGDFLVYCSFAVLSASPFGLIAPVANLLQYAFDAIPKSEAMNAKRYGEVWREYTLKVKAFVPFLI